ncbi:MAG: c-type cytochrome [Betaproteobacteria bacterium]|uniref:C-type cytochrome n=1 Tax=Candidatus Proximibacter danicus TaxID=2954365 RepID=A0A9D7K1W4_9PROT|nr:c-type cytochrome [Candidatus Proximibacter danicus]
MKKLVRNTLMLAALPLAVATAYAAPAKKQAASAAPAAPTLSAEDKAATGKVYFERCAGCHGMLRKGATGKNLEPANTTKLGQARLEKVLAYGTEGGMVNFDDILSKKEIANMATYLQMPAEAPPEWSLADIKGSWKLLIPVDKRPTKQMNNVNLNNIFSVTLRDSGEVALIDGDTKKIWAVIKTGYAVHISRLSTSGRYVHVIGRDGRYDLIDMWTEMPTTVATLKAGFEARSIETSKFKGYEDKYAVVGSYWPPQYTILDGLTLEPLKNVSTRGNTVDGNYHPEPRVASIVASEHKPEWVINIKETGMIKLVDYSDLNNLKEITVNSAKFLHDGGWDSTKRYFLVAANASNKVAVVDTQEGKLAALVNTAKIPHPGRGANFKHPKFGPVWATSHLGSDVISIIGTDPENNKDNAWKVVQELKNHGANSLFVKTHPKSENLWADAPLNPDAKLAGSVTVYKISELGGDAKPEILDLAAAADLGKTKGIQRVVHGEYNEKGDEIWFSVWTGNKTEASAIVVVDDKTRKVKTVIKDKRLVTPTGKFNVYNTMHDIY